MSPPLDFSGAGVLLDADNDTKKKKLDFSQSGTPIGDEVVEPAKAKPAEATLGTYEPTAPTVSTRVIPEAVEAFKRVPPVLTPVAEKWLRDRGAGSNMIGLINSPSVALGIGAAIARGSQEALRGVLAPILGEQGARDLVSTGDAFGGMPFIFRAPEAPAPTAARAPRVEPTLGEPPVGPPPTGEPPTPGGIPSAAPEPAAPPPSEPVGSAAGPRPGASLEEAGIKPTGEPEPATGTETVAQINPDGTVTEVKVKTGEPPPPSEPPPPTPPDNLPGLTDSEFRSLFPKLSDEQFEAIFNKAVREVPTVPFATWLNRLRTTMFGMAHPGAEDQQGQASSLEDAGLSLPAVPGAAPAPEQETEAAAAPVATPTAETAAPPVKEVPASALKPGDQVVINGETLKVEAVRPWTGDDIGIKLEGVPKLQVGHPDTPVQTVVPEAERPVEAHGGPWTPLLDKNGDQAKTRQGEPLYENPNGLRGTMDNGVPYHEAATEDPKKGLVPKNADDRREQFQTAEEAEAAAKSAPKTEEKPKPKPAPTKPTDTDKPAAVAKPATKPATATERPEAEAAPSPDADIPKARDLRDAAKKADAQVEPKPEASVKSAPEAPPASTPAEKPSTEVAKPEAPWSNDQRVIGHIQDIVDAYRRDPKAAGEAITALTEGEWKDAPPEVFSRLLDRVQAALDRVKAAPTEHPGLRIKSLETGKETVIQPSGTVPPAAQPESSPEPGQNQANSGPETVTHVTKKGKTLTGTIRRDLTMAEAKAIDKYAFRKDGGIFIRSSAAEPSAATPEPPVAPEKVESGWVNIGTNMDGNELFMRPDGVRSYVVNGIRHTEPVQLRPTREGMRSSAPVPADKPDEFKVAVPKGTISEVEYTPPTEVVPEAIQSAPIQTPLTDRPIPSSLDVAEQQAKKNQTNAPPSVFPKPGSETDPTLANNIDRLREEYGPDGLMARIVAQWLHERESLPPGDDRVIKPQSVQSAAEFVYEGKLADNSFSRDRMYDAVESGVNMFISMQPERFAPTGDLARAKEQAADLAEIKSRLPTQTVRSGDKVKLQQFSTPPDYAFAASWAANIRPGETVIEPSAGTGGIAVHAMNAGAKVIGNEISPQRRAMMANLPFERITAENAEQLHNILPRDIRPTVIVMNPPFSSAGDRMGGKMVIETGAVHIEQALKRLEPGGRLVAIVGDGMKPEGAETAGKGGRNNATGATFRAWWKKIGAEYDVRANIGVGGEIYRKYGTTFPTRLLVIDKVAPSGQPPVVTTALTSAELLDALQGVRDARPGSAGEPVADQSGGAPVAQPGQGASGPAGAVRPPTGDVGTGSGQDRPPAPDKPKPAGTGGGQAGGVRPGGGPRPAGGVSGDAAPVQQSKPDPQGGTGQPAVQPPTGEVSPGSGQGGDTSHTRPDGSDLAVTPPAPELLETSIVVPEEQTGGELTESVYEDYWPQRISVEGAQPHPGPLVQSAAMASVLPPAVTYKTALPKKLITDGAVSAAQLEAIVYAGNAHSQTLEKDKDGVVKRRGFFIGDGTGVGKGREVAGIILDNKWQGRKKAIWVSEKMPLANDAKRDWAGLGQNANEILVHNKIKAGDEIKHEGILFTTYDTVKSGEKFAGSGEGLKEGAAVVVKNKGGNVKGTLKNQLATGDWVVSVTGDDGRELQYYLPAKDIALESAEPKSRVQQIVDWVGKDFDGVIAFDEAHNMANAVGEKGKRGVKDASAKALAGLELQNALPNARVVYVSATGATEVNNLAYADRLGLWGPGTAFANRSDFLSRVASGGVAAMELVARDMKALGYYTARSLSYDGVEYDRVQHDLTPPQREMYDKIADAWQLVLRNMMQALEDTGADGKGGPKSAILSAFWGGHQRFFNQLITSLQMPSVIEGIDKDLAEGRQAVLQLVNTNEAGQERALDKSKARGDEDLEELDMSPRDQLLQLVDKAFPIWQYETYVDDDGNKRVRLVIDSEGNKVANPEAVAAKENLLLDLGSLRVPDGPLEILINHYGPEAVSEVTGRKQRVVNKPDETGRMKKVLEKRGADANVAEANSFQSGKKKILVFSQAGGTGRSYHDDKTADRVDDTGRLAMGGNSGARRSHYLVQAGWRADTAVQGFGRTHRTNQWTAPIFHLVTTDLEGQKRFISSIARRLGQLGALTKGERRTGDQGMFGLQDNLESDEARAGLVQLFRDIHEGKVEGFSEDDLAEQMGLVITTPEGSLRDELPPMTQFLNRVLSLKVTEQNRVFNEFATRFRDIVDRAAAAGTLDAGTETYKADKIEKVSDQVVYTDPNSGAETRHVHLKTHNRNYPTSFQDMMSGQSSRTGWNAPEFFIQNKRSGYVSAVTPTTFTKVEPNGQVTEHYRVSTPIDWQYVSKDELDDSLRATGTLNRITNMKEAKTLWDERVAKTPEFKEADLHIITGAILPIWDRLAGQPKIFRLQTDSGERMLGRVVDNKVINETLTSLGAEAVKLNITPAEVIEKIMGGGVATLANGWTIKRRRVAQEYRLEITGTDLYSHMADLETVGVFRERIPGTYDTRYFIPTGEGGAATIEAITKRRPIVSVEGD